MSGSEEDQARAAGDFTCLNIVLRHIDRLPARTDKHVLATEQDMLRQHFQRFVQYIISEDDSLRDLAAKMAEIKARAERLCERLDGRSMDMKSYDRKTDNPLDLAAVQARMAYELSSSS